MNEAKGLTKTTNYHFCVKKDNSTIAEVFLCSFPNVKKRCKHYTVETIDHRRNDGLNKSLLQRLYAFDFPNRECYIDA